MLKFMDDTGRAPDRAARTAEGRNAHRGALPPPVAVPGAIGQIHPQPGIAVQCILRSGNLRWRAGTIPAGPVQ
jgi:hypothetical protein